MDETYGKRLIYEFCRTKHQMVRLEVIRSQITMPDRALAEVALAPVGCNREEQCRREGIRCLVYDKDHGIDPCPEVWKREI